MFIAEPRAAEKQKGKGLVGVAGYKQVTPLGFQEGPNERANNLAPLRSKFPNAASVGFGVVKFAFPDIAVLIVLPRSTF